MRCFVVAGFLLTSASCGPSAIAELLALFALLWSDNKISTALGDLLCPGPIVGDMKDHVANDRPGTLVFK